MAKGKGKVAARMARNGQVTAGDVTEAAHRRSQRFAKSITVFAGLDISERIQGGIHRIAASNLLAAEDMHRTTCEISGRGSDSELQAWKAVQRCRRAVEHVTGRPA